jgi:hypothetical protein
MANLDINIFSQSDFTRIFRFSSVPEMIFDCEMMEMLSRSEDCRCAPDALRFHVT